MTGERSKPVEVMALMEAPAPVGPAKNLLILARMLAEMGSVHIRIVTFTRGQESNAFIQACKEMGVDVEVIRERFRFDPVIPQLRELAARYKPDIIQTHNIKSHLFLRLSGLRDTFPWIAFVHGYTAEDLKMKAYNQVDRWTLPAANRVVAVCGPFAERLRKWGVKPERIVVRHNAVSEIPKPQVNEVERLRHSLGIRAGEQVVLSVGRLSREKAQADLVRATAIVKQRFDTSHFRVVLAGDGPERGQLEGLCKEVGVAETVIFAGNSKNIPVFYGMADMVVLPSHWDGSPNALLEAMMAGKAVLATRVGGVPEIVQDGETGVLVAAKDIDALAKRMVEMLGNGDLRRKLGESARDWVCTHHSREDYARSIVKLYEGVLEQKRTR